MAGQLYTIGHSRQAYEHFLALLQMYAVDYLLDVRSVPYSKYADAYNRETLQERLPGDHIAYAFAGKYFGARPQDPELYDANGQLDFAKTTSSDTFRRGMRNVLKGLAAGHNIALMCTELDPINCHRAVMVMTAFSLAGIIALHILADGTAQSQNDLDRRLVDMYFSKNAQISMFSDPDMLMRPADELVELAYRKRNRDIGWRLPKTRKDE